MGGGGGLIYYKIFAKLHEMSISEQEPHVRQNVQEREIPTYA